MNNELSNEEYAWIDMLVACPLHATLHRLANEGLNRVPQRWRMRVHLAFHLSFRRSWQARIVRR